MNIMCGIIAYLGKLVGGNYILEGINILRNRGYDSIGCCSLDKDGKIMVTKYASRGNKNSYELFEENFEIHQQSKCLVAHTRWATTGVVSDANSHPHLDTIGPDEIALVHNGIISNYQKLREFLMKEGIKFRSETDTEVIVNLLGYYYSKNEKKNMMDAIKLTLKELEGTWALIIINKMEPNTLYVCKNGSPIVVGYSDDMCIVSSESSGFSNYLRNYHVVPDHHILKIEMVKDEKGEEKIRFYKDDKMTELSTNTLIQQNLHALTPDPYPHWTLKEIMEQPESAFRAMNQGGRIWSKSRVKLGGLNDHTDELLSIKHLTIIASGTSYHAGLLGQKFFQLISGFDTIRVIEASEFTLADIAMKDSGILMLSQSGETRDVIRCMEIIRENRPGVIIFSIVNVVESLIAREADCGIYLNAGREVGVASTKSFTNQLVVLQLLALWFAQNRDINRNIRTKIIKSLHNMKELIKETLDQIIIPCQNVIEYISKYEHLFILGRDKGYPVAMEGALKIKEISYIHAEAYPGGGLKHGPLALISQGTPIIIIRIGDSDVISKMDIAAEETKSRGAYLISISTTKCQNHEIYNHEIIIANDIYLTPLLATLPMQYIAYLLAVKKGNNPDYPRNLAKCVTVI